MRMDLNAVRILIVVTSGNEAYVEICEIAGKTAASVGWRDDPTSEDMQEADARVMDALEKLTGDQYQCEVSAKHGDEKERARAIRAYMGGGMDS